MSVADASRRLALLAAVSLALPSTTQASNAPGSLGLAATLGSSYLALELEGTLALDTRGKTTGRILLARSHSDLDGESRANQVSLGLEHQAAPAWDTRGGLAYWRDTSNRIQYLGPRAGATYIWESTEDADDRTPEELLLASLDAELFLYSVDLEVDTGGRSGRRRLGSSSTQRTARTLQFHPILEIEKPLLSGDVRPFVALSHYFYSTDPADLEATAARTALKLSAAAADSVSALVGGFLRNTWDVGASIALPTRTWLRASFGRQQAATDGAWSSVLGLSVSHPVTEHWKARVAWRRSLPPQPDPALDYFTVGATYLF